MLLLALLVLAHFLCSVCHTSIASADTPPTENPAPQAVAPVEVPAPGALLHGFDGGKTALLCHSEDDSSADQRLMAGQLLVLLGLGAAVLVIFGLTRPRLNPWPARRSSSRTRSGTRLLLSLCIQRV